MKYIVYATDDDGEGRVMKIGEYEQVDDIILKVGMFSKDVVITIEEEHELLSD